MQDFSCPRRLRETFVEATGAPEHFPQVAAAMRIGKPVVVSWVANMVSRGSWHQLTPFFGGGALEALESTIISHGMFLAHPSLLSMLLSVLSVPVA